MEISPMKPNIPQVHGSPIQEQHKPPQPKPGKRPEDGPPPPKRDNADISDEAHGPDEKGPGNMNALLDGLKGEDEAHGGRGPEGPGGPEDPKARENDETGETKDKKKEKLMEELKALEKKIQDKMSEYDSALQSGNKQKAESLMGEFNDMMKDREDLLGKLGMKGLDTEQNYGGGNNFGGGGAPAIGGGGAPGIGGGGNGGYSPIYSGGKGPGGGYFDGFPATHGSNFSTTPYGGAAAGGSKPSAGTAAQSITGKVAGSSGQDAVNLGRQFLGENSIDCKGKIPNFTAAGGQTNNCADFVSSLLESTGRISGHHINVVELEKSLKEQGYTAVSRENAQPGDVWISGSKGHTEMCSEAGGTKCIGSNNDRQGHQVISENSVSGGTFYHLNTEG